MAEDTATANAAKMESWRAEALEEEIARLQSAVRERDEELRRRELGAAKLAKHKETEAASLKASLTKEKEDKLAKLSAAHNKRLAAKDEEAVCVVEAG